MKKWCVSVFMLMVLLCGVQAADAAVVNLIDSLNYYDADDILKVGDGFTTHPLDLDNDAGVRDYQAVFSGTFILDSVAGDDVFSIDMACSGYGDGGGGSYFMLNDNDTIFSLGSSGSTFSFSRTFSEYLQLGTNTITYRIGPDNAYNLDDYRITQFDLTYAEAKIDDDNSNDQGAPVPEPATMVLTGLGLIGCVARRKK